MTNEPASIAEAVRVSDRLLQLIMPVLAGHSPQIQGIVVVELLAIWLAGHDPTLRQQMLKLQMDTLPELVELWHGPHARQARRMSGADDPLLVLTSVSVDILPIIEALQRLHRDVGSVQARRVLFGETPEPPEVLRLICVGCVDADDVNKLSRDLAYELRDDPESAALASRVKVISYHDGLRVVVFRELICIRANDLQDGEQA